MTPTKYCSHIESFLVNWRLYAQLVQVCITLFNAMPLLVQSLLEVQGQQDLLPAFDYPQLEDEYVLFFCSSVSNLLNDHTKGRFLMISTSGFHIGSPETMREWWRWICNHIETLDKVRVTTYFFNLNVLCSVSSFNRFSPANLYRTSF